MPGPFDATTVSCTLKKPNPFEFPYVCMYVNNKERPGWMLISSS